MCFGMRVNYASCDGEGESSGTRKTKQAITILHRYGRERKRPLGPRSTKAFCLERDIGNPVA